MTIRVGFIGAGAVNFGGHGNKWDHATRLEKIPDVIFVGIADPFTRRAEEVLQRRRDNYEKSRATANANSAADGGATAPGKWDSTKVYENYKTMIEDAKPDAIFIGVPPFAHGSSAHPIESDCIEAGVHIFVEKPISCTPPEEMDVFRKMVEEGEKRVIVSVGYMFRYSKLILKMKELAKSFGPIKLFHARYNCAYSKIDIESWWDTDRAGGPLIEQATHFVDLARFFCGEVLPESLHSHCIKANSPMGKLGSIPVDEEKVPPNRRISRVTTALWKFESGAIGTLTHTALLHGWAYDLQIELWGDGYYIFARDPYDKCELLFRKPGSEVEELLTLPDDPYLHEVEVFMDAIRTGDRSKIQSSYADAFKTYDLTWQIRKTADSARDHHPIQQ